MTLSFDAALQAFAPRLPLAVGLSGGADSTALLLGCAARWPGQVRAIHVHHGLQSAAGAFERHCVDLCARLGVPLQVQRVDARHAPGQSPEDAARIARYKAFAVAAQAESAQGAIQSIALAQHADDQVETLLLALSRGAGVAGLAAMPAFWQRDGLDWHRPLLAVPGAELRDWLRARGQAWVEDPSNQDERYTRNRIRARLLPALEAAFPQFRDTFARSARHAAQASELLEDLARQDLAEVGDPPRIAGLQQLGRARQANVLRHWLRQAHQTTPSSAQLDALQAQIAACATRGHRIHLKVGRGFVEREGLVLRWYNP
ncbi:tRNA lysidine(34) synthetase TilS [Simplicispira lacusdiani]|uniref:tRNA lysidine(34) synthetase TilS n=1 Tax=Simplicispira lacusdiani TaxID=2213010 RepID=UPI000E73D9F1|nr:tRNA lysidine(34) synthetase TilS [Simplicispira lacusdiani]